MRGFSLLRIERNGVEQTREGIEIGEGEQVSGIRVVLDYGTGIVRGQVRIEGGTLPPESRLFIRLHRTGDNGPQFFRPTEVDARGRFVIENLAAGEYQLMLMSYSSRGTGARGIPPVTQTVIVTDGIEAEVTLVVDLSKKKEGQQ